MNQHVYTRGGDFEVGSTAPEIAPTAFVFKATDPYDTVKGCSLFLSEVADQMVRLLVEMDRCCSPNVAEVSVCLVGQLFQSFDFVARDKPNTDHIRPWTIEALTRTILGFRYPGVKINPDLAGEMALKLHNHFNVTFLATK